MKTRSLFCLCVAVAAFGLPAPAADWPQWRGPDRNDVSRETGLLKKWEAPPKLLWTNRDAGAGYGGIAVVGDNVVTQGADDKKEFVLCIDAKTGAKKWLTPYADRFGNGWGDGPRGTPTIDGERVYAIGGQGELVCVELASGKKVWEKSLTKDLGGKLMSGWGYSESPLVDGDRLICTPGGAKGTLAALDKKTGEVVWRSEGVKNNAGYSSIIVAEVGGIRQYIQLTRDGVIGVSAKDGKLLWNSPLGATGTAAIPTPVFSEGYVFATSGYGDSKPGLVKLTTDGDNIKAEEVYAEKTLTNKHGGVVLLDGVLYGFTENGGKWVALDFKTGKELGWGGKKLERGSLTFADGRLYLYGEKEGTAVLIEPDPKTWTEAGRFTIPEHTKLPRKSGLIWTHPVVANGKLYLRDQDLIFCYDVKAN